MLSGSGMRTLGGKALNAAKGSLLLRLVVIGHDEVFFRRVRRRALSVGERERGEGEEERRYSSGVSTSPAGASAPHPVSTVRYHHPQSLDGGCRRPLPTPI